MSKPPFPKYKTSNRKDYNASLKARGGLVVWLNGDMQCHARSTGKCGRQAVFSDAAIQFCLTIKYLSGLALRQATGFVESWLQLAGLNWLVPDFNTLSRRQKTVTIKISSRKRH